MESKGRACSFWYVVEEQKDFADPIVSVMMHLDLLRS